MITARHPQTGQLICKVRRCCSGMAWGLTRAQAEWLIEHLRGAPMDARQVDFMGLIGRYGTRYGQPRLLSQALHLRVNGREYHVWKYGNCDEVAAHD